MQVIFMGFGGLALLLVGVLPTGEALPCTHPPVAEFLITLLI
jgi:hypothetical protein